MRDGQKLRGMVTSAGNGTLFMPSHSSRWRLAASAHGDRQSKDEALDGGNAQFVDVAVGA
jgi:hypothetical protein